MSYTPAMPTLTPEQLRFELLRGLQSLSRSTLNDLAGKPDKRERALSIAANELAQRFSGYTVTAPDPHPGMDFGRMEKG